MINDLGQRMRRHDIVAHDQAVRLAVRTEIEEASGMGLVRQFQQRVRDPVRLGEQQFLMTIFAQARREFRKVRGRKPDLQESARNVAPRIVEAFGRIAVGIS